MSLKRLKNIVKSGQISSSKDVATIAITEVDTESPSMFLQLPHEVRTRIYEYAFARTPLEQLRALHYGPQASSAGGLLLTCRKINAEIHRHTAQAYHNDVVVSLWPQSRHDSLPYASSAFKEKPVLQAWKHSRHGITLSKRPDTVQKLALSMSLTRDTRTFCEGFIETKILRNTLTNVKEIYIKLCICGALRWLHETPEHTMSFCQGLETFAYNFPALEHLHVLYCGQQWPVWIQALGDVPFPDIALTRHEVRMFSGANWSIKRADARKRTWGPINSRNPAQVQPPPAGFEVDGAGTESSCRLRTVMTWNHTAAHPGENVQQVSWKERTVCIDYYDSWTVLEDRCVRNKPPLKKTEKRHVAPSRLTAKPTIMQKVASRVRESVEAAPLGPTWGIHKYIPETRDAGLSERGSHWRR